MELQNPKRRRKIYRKILKIEEYPKHGKVIHISIGNLKVGNPDVENGFAKELTHIPISEEVLDKSVTVLKRKNQTSE
ncbi:hypothetical protein [Chryseobacterium luquanense]|uniref:Uncharacterized protein n=1 Tax=Chryseobacterium luquanense TaxID=2983766 RepID=A0ABT3Y970_9FLAO|nr:hypothetical protein [Chryseobacterium luquanense]MCX8534604.1 hypothetical protein [Chryseobacterium luquanense]